MPGRVGDSPIVGSGGIADNELGAVSTTGHGESILKVGLARRVVNTASAAHDGAVSMQAAAEQALQYMQDRVQGQGGVIALGPGGDVGIAFTTKRMCWARADATGLRMSGIERGDPVSP